MPLPTLDNFQAMIKPLHQAAELFGPIHNAVRDFQNNYLHLAMEIQPDGLSSGTYPQGGSLALNFKTGAMIYQRPSGETVTFALADHTQESLFNAVLEALKADELATFFSDVKADTLAEGLMRKITGAEDTTVFLKLEEVTHQETLGLDMSAAGDYADALYTIFTGVARFRARLNGHMTPIVVWPEHFDLSTLWFVDPEMDDHKAHLNFGFAPYTPNLYERPYFYAYAYPYPENFEPPALPNPAFWNTEGWTGVVVHYDDIAKQDNPALFVENLCREVFEVLRGILD